MYYYTEKIQIAILNVLKRGATHKRHIVERALKENPSLIHPRDIRKNLEYLHKIGYVGKKYWAKHIFVSKIKWRDIENSAQKLNRFTLKEEASTEGMILRILEKGSFSPLVLVEIILNKKKYLNRKFVYKAINNLRKYEEIKWNHDKGEFSLPKTRKSQS